MGKTGKDKPPTAVARHQSCMRCVYFVLRTRQRLVADDCMNTFEVYKNLKNSGRGRLLLSVSFLHCFEQ